jgi:hypothetical protein
MFRILQARLDGVVEGADNVGKRSCGYKQDVFISTARKSQAADVIPA